MLSTPKKNGLTPPPFNAVLVPIHESNPSYIRKVREYQRGKVGVKHQSINQSINQRGNQKP